jgi:hypothetical protein
MRKVSVPLSESGLETLIRECERIISLPARMDAVCARLAQMAAEEAGRRFASVRYVGDVDLNVTWQKRGNGYAVVASGQTVAFLEFGAGISAGRQDIFRAEGYVREPGYSPSIKIFSEHRNSPLAPGYPPGTGIFPEQQDIFWVPR